MDVTALHLAENNLTRLSQSMFLGRSRLKQIFIRHSNIHDIENATFSGLDHLELIGKFLTYVPIYFAEIIRPNNVTYVLILDLGFNQLKQLLGHEFIGAVSLRELYLENNQLVTIAKDTFKHLTQLTILKLDGNLLIGKSTI